MVFYMNKEEALEHDGFTVAFYQYFNYIMNEVLLNFFSKFYDME